MLTEKVLPLLETADFDPIYIIMCPPVAPAVAPLE